MNLPNNRTIMPTQPMNVERHAIVKRGEAPVIPNSQHILNLQGLFETVDTAPTAVPKTFYQSIKLYANGATYRLYIYDSLNQAWRYATLT